MVQNRHDAREVARLIDNLVDQIVASLSESRTLNVVGIRTRGEALAERLAVKLRERGFTSIGRGALDITLYRDDLAEIGPRPLVRPTNLTIDTDGQPMLLVDDVAFTGRTVRAALDALADFGRPSAIRLAVLVDRGGRELPIQPDFCALRLTDLPRERHVQVHFTEFDGTDEILIT